MKKSLLTIGSAATLLVAISGCSSVNWENVGYVSPANEVNLKANPSVKIINNGNLQIGNDGNMQIGSSGNMQIGSPSSSQHQSKTIEKNQARGAKSSISDKLLWPILSSVIAGVIVGLIMLAVKNHWLF